MTATSQDAPQAASGAKDATVAGTQASEPTPYELSPEKMMMDNLFILGMLFFIFYFILIRPQQKRLKFQRDLMKSLQKGNRVMTVGGILGTITKLEGDDIIVVEIAQGIKVRMARSAVTEVVSDKTVADTANDN
jgi:preprotein translocase subunit YajC